MSDFSTIQDYSIIDNFINNSLKSFNQKLFGSYDEKTGYFEEIEPETEQEVEKEKTNPSEYQEQPEMTEEEAYDYMFGPEFDVPQNTNDSYEPSFYSRGSETTGSSNTGSNSGFRSFATYEEGKQALVNQLIKYQTNRSKTGVKSNSTLLEAMSKYAPKGDGANDPVAYAKFIAKKLGVSVNTPISQLDTKQWADAIEKMEGNKVGNNPGNLRKQTGGKGVAVSPEQQFTGLNDQSLDELYMPLQGTNPIRGLDSGEPVYVQDEYGNSNILLGPEDIVFMTGGVYEKRLSKKYKTK